MTYESLERLRRTRPMVYADVAMLKAACIVLADNYVDYRVGWFGRVEYRIGGSYYGRRVRIIDRDVLAVIRHMNAWLCSVDQDIMSGLSLVVDEQ